MAARRRASSDSCSQQKAANGNGADDAHSQLMALGVQPPPRSIIPTDWNAMCRMFIGIASRAVAA